MELQNFFYTTALNEACLSGNFELVKYLISLNKIDFADKAILTFYLWCYK